MIKDLKDGELQTRGNVNIGGQKWVPAERNDKDRQIITVYTVIERLADDTYRVVEAPKVDNRKLRVMPGLSSARSV